MKIKKLLTLLTALCLMLLICTTFAFAATSVTLNCPSTVKVGSTAIISGTATAGSGVSIKIVDSSNNIVYFDIVKAATNGIYTNNFIPANDLAGETVTVVAGYGSYVATKTLTITTGGGGGGSATTTVTANNGNKVDNTSIPNTVKCTTTIASAASRNGKASCAVTDTQIASAVTQAVAAAAAAAGGTGTRAAIEIKVTTDANATSLETSIPKTSISSATDKGATAITVSSSIASITFNAKTLDGIVNAATDDLKITVEGVDTSTLSASAQAEVGDHPVFNFSVTSGNSVISNFASNVTVEVPYTLANGEDGNNIVIYYVNAQGNLEMVKNCVYDETTGKVVFKTTHFSNYAVGYNKVSFSDVSSWYKDYVSYLSARGIITGKGESKFAPTENITRAEFAQILANMSGDELSSYTASSFSDVKTADWYCEAVTWAYQNGVVLGTDGKFNPNAYITRQDMALMLGRYTDKIMNYTLSATVDEISFTDASSISDYAADAVSTMQQAGIISGRSNNTFAPKANATRAETAKMVAVLVQAMIK